MKPLRPDPGNTGVVEITNLMRKAIILAGAAIVGASATGIAKPVSGVVPKEKNDSVTMLEEVAVTATRASRITPIAFTNVTEKELEELNTGVDLPFLLQMTPSLIATSDAGAGVGYSYFRVRGSDGSRINVTANGIPVNDAESHKVYFVDMPDIASSIKDIQVQRGVGTSTNGAGAFGASINMQTSLPSRERFGALDMSYGSYNTNKQTLRLGTGMVGGHWAADARISRVASDGYIDRATSNLWSYFGQMGYYNGGTSLRVIAFGGKERTYQAWNYSTREEMEEYGRRYNSCGLYYDAEGKPTFYQNQYDKYVQHNFQLLLNHRFNGVWALNAALHYTKGDGYYEQYKTNRTLSEYGLSPFYYVNDEGETVKVKKSDLVRLKKMDNGFGGGTFALTYTEGRVNGVIGGALNNYKGHHFGQIAWVRNYVGAIDPLQEYYRNIGEKFDFNIYARANVEISKGLSAYGDVQYRHINYQITGLSDNFDYATDAMQLLDVHRRYDFFNPKVGVNYERGANRVFFSWSVAHKEPVRDNFTDADPGHMPSSERMMDYELGYTFTGGNFSAGANLYYMDYKNQLVLTGQLSDTGNPLSANVPNSYRAGVELMGGWQPASWFTWQLNATLSANRIKNFVEYVYEDEWTNPITIDHGNTTIAFSPSVIVNNDFRFAWRGLDASLYTQYVSRQYLSNADTKAESLKGYCVTNLSAGYTFSSLAGLKKLRVGLTIYNLFSAKYENNGWAAAGYTVVDGKPEIYRYAGFAPQAPINVMGQVSLEF